MENFEVPPRIPMFHFQLPSRPLEIPIDSFEKSDYLSEISPPNRTLFAFFMEVVFASLSDSDPETLSGSRYCGGLLAQALNFEIL
jgi:hypothetical protein